MKSILRLIGNFVIIGLLVLFFRNLGWIEFISPPQLSENPTLNHLSIAIVIGLQMLIVGEVFEFIYWIVKTATLGLAKFVYPIVFVVVGYLKIIIPMLYLTDWYKPTFDFFPVLIMSLAIGLIRIPKWLLDKDEEKK
jgi:hypothetical protein